MCPICIPTPQETSKQATTPHETSFHPTPTRKSQPTTSQNPIPPTPTRKSQPQLLFFESAAPNRGPRHSAPVFGEPPQKQLPQTRQLRALAGSATFLAAPPNAPSLRRRLPTQLSLAKRPAQLLAMSVLTPTSGSSAQCLRASAPVRPPRPWKTSQPAASFSDGHPSTHGATSRRRTGTGQGPTSAWLFRRHRSTSSSPHRGPSFTQDRRTAR